MIGVTTGVAYTDIDALAGTVALAEALTLAGRPAVAVLRGSPNVSVPKRFRTHEAFDAASFDFSEFILVDVSDPAHIPPYVAVERVSAIYDHHFGHKRFWRERCAETCIERIGAAATLIWEAAQRLGVAERLSKVSATLVASAIVSNTADLVSPLTRARDRAVLADAEVQAGLKPGWRQEYFAEVDASVITDVSTALRTDTKIVRLRPGESLLVAQLETSHRTTIMTALSQHRAAGHGLPDVIIVPLRVEGVTVVVTESERIAAWLREALRTEYRRYHDLFTLTLDGVLFRKMIIPKLMRSIIPEGASILQP